MALSMAPRGKSFEDYQTDWLLRHAVERAIEIVSEAARRIPLELQAMEPQIPWQQIMGIGNVLRHEYHRISDRVIWNVIQEYLLPLRVAVVAIDSRLGPEDG